MNDGSGVYHHTYAVGAEYASVSYVNGAPSYGYQEPMPTRYPDPQYEAHWQGYVDRQPPQHQYYQETGLDPYATAPLQHDASYSRDAPLHYRQYDDVDDDRSKSARKKRRKNRSATASVGARDRGQKASSTAGPTANSLTRPVHDKPEHKKPSHTRDSALESKGKKSASRSPDLEVYLRYYDVTVRRLHAIDLIARHPNFSLPQDVAAIEVHWPRTAQFSTSLIDDPPIPINFSIPMAINNDIVPSHWSAQSSSTTKSQLREGAVLYEVRVLVVRGSPIDISAPKSGVIHSNNNLMFLLLEQWKSNHNDGRHAHLCAPGGFFDAQLDAHAADRNVRSYKRPTDKDLIRTAIRTVKEQLALDLSGCTRWVRFLDVEYAADGSSASHRVVYFVPSVWELLPSVDTFPDVWKAYRATKLHSPALMAIERLKNRLHVTSADSPEYEELQAQIVQKTSDLKYMTSPARLSDEPAPPDSPQLLITVNPSATNGSRASNFTLQNLLTMSTAREFPKETAELFLVAHRFDEYLQYYFGACILLHAAMMRDHVLQGQRPVVFHGVPLVAQDSLLTVRHPKKRPLESGDVSNSLNEANNPFSTDAAKRACKDETSRDATALHQFLPGAAPASADAMGASTRDYRCQSEPTLNWRSHSLFLTATSTPERGVPFDADRARPPHAPEHRNYRVMQAFRYFDLNRLGQLRGEDLVNVFLSLGLGLSLKVAIELSAAADLSLPHYPFIESGFNYADRMRYKPTCDWLRRHGLQLPKPKHPLTIRLPVDQFLRLSSLSSAIESAKQQR